MKLSHLLLPLLVLFLQVPLAAKEMIPTPQDEPVLGELEPVLVKALLGKEVSADASWSTVYQQPAILEQIKKHDLKLFGGPMLGCLSDTGAKVWVRTIRPASVQVVVGTGPKLNGRVETKAATSTIASDLTAICELTGLKSLTEYTYDVLVDGKSVLGSKLPTFRTAPARGEKASFDVAFGGGARYNPSKERIWDTIAQQRPAAFLFLGDNLYMDMPTQRNLQSLYYYRRQLRPEYRRLVAGASCYAIWDDHDFGANDTAGGPDTFKPSWKFPVWKVFKNNWVNAYYGGGEEQPGCWFDFSIGDVDFFMTDGRYYRSFKDGTMLGPVQKKWLKQKLRASTATFKVIASGTLWTETADKGGKDSWWGVPEEREEIFSLIDKEEIGGVILLSADRHRNDIYKIERPNGYPLYEFETSKLTNNHTHGTKKQAIFSYNKGNFFGKLTFDTTKADPEITVRCITIDGKTVHVFKVKRSELEK
jgi:alkaline phosphatase D